MDSLDGHTLAFLRDVVLLVVLSGLVLARFRQRLIIYPIVAALYTLAFAWLSFVFSRDIFDGFNRAAIGIFFGGTSLLILSAGLTWSRHRIMSTFFSCLALILIGIASDAFLLEPRWLETSFYKIETPRMSRPVRLVVVSDLQTDHVSSFEESVLVRTMQLKPDAIFLPGDFIQAEPQRRQHEIDNLRKLLERTGVSAPEGVYVTRGDAEADDWTCIFEGLGYVVFDRSATISTDEFAVTGLSLQDSFSLSYQPPQTDLFHIMVGHRPGFSLDLPERRRRPDLVIAGHTHGGQVQIPGLGPLLTFSRVSADVGAGGLFLLKSGDERERSSRLLLSRGIGMERGHAPRIRFCCRPQLMVIDLIPEPGVSRKSH